jgi:putative component of toxin-antitoxin plasmid stabilization module
MCIISDMLDKSTQKRDIEKAIRLSKEAEK